MESEREIQTQHTPRERARERERDLKGKQWSNFSVLNIQRGTQSKEKHFGGHP